jgi:hypothetical protein
MRKHERHLNAENTENAEKDMENQEIWHEFLGDLRILGVESLLFCL